MKADESHSVALLNHLMIVFVLDRPKQNREKQNDDLESM